MIIIPNDEGFMDEDILNNVHKSNLAIGGSSMQAREGMSLRKNWVMESGMD